MPAITKQVQRIKFAPAGSTWWVYLGPRRNCTNLFFIHVTSSDSALARAMKRSIAATLVAAESQGLEVTVIYATGSAEITAVQLESVQQYRGTGRWLGVRKTPGDSRTPGDGFGVFAVHGALLRTGRVLLWSGRAESGTFLYASWTWDPCTDQEFGPQPFNPSLGVTATWASDNRIDMFCAHQSWRADGRLLVTGGAGGLSEGDARGNTAVHVFDPVNEQWSELSPMANGRWYPTQVTLEDGRVVVLSGRPSSGQVAQAEILSPPSYVPQPVAGGDRPLPIYPGLHMVKGGKVFFTGTSWRYEIMPGPTASLLMTGPTAGMWETYPNAANPGQDIEPNQPLREEGTSILLPPAQDGKILLIGGGYWTGAAQDPAAEPDAVEVLDTQTSTPTWTTISAMHRARINVNAVLLPDRNVLIVGGHSRHKFTHSSSEHVLEAEILDPTVALDPTNPADPYTDTGPMGRARMYHSVALLLPDGSVFVGGGDDSHAPPTTPGEPIARDQKSFEIFRPTYFFHGRRPIIDAVQGVGPADFIRYNQSFEVETMEADHIADVVLMRPGATTHHTDSEQRCVPLQFIRQPGRLVVDAIDDSTVAPPGYYMLFIVDGAGRPCQWAEFVRLDT